GRDDTLEPEVLEGIANHCLGSFSGVALALKGGAHGIEEAKLRSSEPGAGWLRDRGECRQLFEGVQAWHKAACANELPCVLVYNGAIAIGRLVQHGKLCIV